MEAGFTVDVADQLGIDIDNDNVGRNGNQNAGDSAFHVYVVVKVRADRAVV